MTPKPPMPKTVKASPHTYTVVRPWKVMCDGVEVDGLCEATELKLSIRRGLKRNWAQEKLTHELAHVALDGIEGVTDEIEEKVVTYMAPRLLQIIKDNPELVRYLAQ